APEGSGPARAVAEFAWLLMNEVRIQGLFRLTGGTRITGAGQAFPWAIAETLNLASGEIVEDTALTLDLAKRGIRTRYVAEHSVSSTFPVDDEAAVVQRARWEHGSLSIQRRVALPLLIEALRTGAMWKAGMALHFLVPPLTLFAGALTVLTASSMLLAPFAGWWLLFLGFGPLVLFSAGVLWAWQRSGREALPPEALRGMWPFLLSKLKVYGKDGRQTAKVWTRTPRDQQEGRS
ncbi:MAG: glycosyltransferase family 2 protein, partial [Pseudomonadota bacterium]